MTLANYQFQFGSFVFGGGNSVYQIQSVDGLEDLPELRTQDDNRGYNDGMFSGRDFLSGRTITMDMLVLGGNGNNAQQNFDLLQNALIPQQNGTTSMLFKLATTDTEKLINCRVRGRKARIDPDYTYGYIKTQYTFFAPDPRYYDSTATTGTMVVQNALGRTYDRTYNLTYGGGSLINSLAVVNNGNTTTYPVITIVGPITNPTIGNLTTNQYITVNTTLINTDSLVIDLLNKTVTLNGVTARNLLAGNSVWFGAPPGTSNYYFSGTNTLLGTTSATVVYRSAYI
jgi:hypothetical protein